MQITRDPRGARKEYFSMKREARGKDVEYAFGVQQSRFATVAGLA